MSSSNEQIEYANEEEYESQQQQLQQTPEKSELLYETQIQENQDVEDQKQQQQQQQCQQQQYPSQQIQGEYHDFYYNDIQNHEVNQTEEEQLNSQDQNPYKNVEIQKQQQQQKKQQQQQKQSQDDQEEYSDFQENDIQIDEKNKIEVEQLNSQEQDQQEDNDIDETIFSIISKIEKYKTKIEDEVKKMMLKQSKDEYTQLQLQRYALQIEKFLSQVNKKLLKMQQQIKPVKSSEMKINWQADANINYEKERLRYQMQQEDPYEEFLATFQQKESENEAGIYNYQAEIEKLQEQNQQLQREIHVLEMREDHTLKTNKLFQQSKDFRQESKTSLKSDLDMKSYKEHFYVSDYNFEPVTHERICSCTQSCIHRKSPQKSMRQSQSFRTQEVQSYQNLPSSYPQELVYYDVVAQKKLNQKRDQFSGYHEIDDFEQKWKLAEEMSRY